jgi:hypothetical protein
VLAAGTERAVLHAAYALLERLGARSSFRGAPTLPQIERAQLDIVEASVVVPAFNRRAIVSDIMTWHYETPARLAMHLEHDRAFIGWMAARGLNSLSYIRHTVDSRLKIEELVPLCRERGIASEYGGHVLQLLLPRDRFDVNPELFPADAKGERNSHGDLCVSNDAALRIVRDGALRYIRENPECELLHVWGADVWKGAWCRCSECAGLSPQLQYMKVVNAIAEALEADGSSVIEAAYLAYHDTIEPDPALRPLRNVWFEWAPRERCYSHAIDDRDCEINPRYLESLKRYIELFDGRGHVFEYYADAILFGGIGAATPSVIMCDLRAYRSLGLGSISCLTFGAHSAIAYPVNLEAFARGTRDPDLEPDRILADTAAELYPACGPLMAEAYRAIARASALIFNGGGDVMRPKLGLRAASTRVRKLTAAYAEITHAIEAAGHIIASAPNLKVGPERDVWHYSREVVSGIAEYIVAGDENGPARRRLGDDAIKKISDAIDRLHAGAPAVRDTWAAYDLEWIRDIWINALRRRLDKISGTPERD